MRPLSSFQSTATRNSSIGSYPTEGLLKPGSKTPAVHSQRNSSLSTYMQFDTALMTDKDKQRMQNFITGRGSQKTIKRQQSKSQRFQQLYLKNGELYFGNTPANQIQRAFYNIRQKSLNTEINIDKGELPAVTYTMKRLNQHKGINGRFRMKRLKSQTLITNQLAPHRQYQYQRTPTLQMSGGKSHRAQSPVLVLGMENTLSQLYQKSIRLQKAMSDHKPNPSLEKKLTKIAMQPLNSLINQENMRIRRSYFAFQPSLIINQTYQTPKQNIQKQMAGFYQSTLAPVKSSQQQTNLPWVEKYRPKTITDIAHQEDVVHALANCLQSNSLPHLLFYGPPGTGKTSTILAVARQMFGDELFRTRVLELNASDDRGIAVIRDKIKKFAQIAVTRQPGQTCPGFKIIILDEADLLTNDAQAALRRVIEKHTSVTRFCLICNYISKIIDPIASRCMKFRFKPISEQSHIERLQYICEQEQVGCTQDAIDLLVNLSEGDLRKSITTLQGSYRLFGDYLTADMIREFAALIPSEIVMGIFNTCWGSFDDMSTLVENLILDGYQPDSLISQFFDLIRLSDGLTDDKKARASEILAEVDYMLTTGANDKLALMKAFTGVQLIVHGQVINVLIY